MFNAVSRKLVFQSSPAPEGECNAGAATMASRDKVFQSSPAPEGECNITVSARTAEGALVSILTRP